MRINEAGLRKRIGVLHGTFFETNAFLKGLPKAPPKEGLTQMVEGALLTCTILLDLMQPEEDTDADKVPAQG